MDNKTDPPKNKAMGARVAKVRGRLSQTAFSKEIDTTQGNLSRIENGQIPSADILLRIARFGKTTVEELLEDEKIAKTIDGPESEVVGSLQSKKYTEAEMDLIEKYANAKAEIAVLKKELEIERGLNQVSKTKGQESRKPGNP